MAIRSGAGTGVVVSLVVFVLTTVFLLILTIVFYAGKTDALEQMAVARDELAKYARPQQRSSDQYKSFEQAASANGQSVAGYLANRHEELMQFVNGDPSVSMEQLKLDMNRYGIDADDGVIRHTLEQYRRDLRSAEVELEGLRTKLADRDAEIAEKQARIEQMTEDHKRALEEVSQEIVAYRNAGDVYRDDLRKTIDQMNDHVEQIEDDYESRIRNLEDEIDAGSQQLVLMRARMSEYESILNEIRTKARDPAMLVDGRVIDVDPGSEQVFLNLGKRDRIVLGMTFEVYDDAASIRVNERTNMLPRGKASLQVIQVDETTSTCKITRSIAGRPVIRNDVVANAIYDPNYRFRFLVHGKFDVDDDGRASEAEADFLRSLVLDWGGEVVIGEELPGDLDFLVLGEQPPLPPPLRPDATQAQIDIWARQRNAKTKYDELFKQASEAQIPILNANRFFILIGHTVR